jgi:hypothetical protein
MAAFNTMKTPLLAKSVVQQHVPTMQELDQVSYFKDFRFFNPLFTAQQNASIKIKLAKELKYDNTVITGQITHNILYKFETYTFEGEVPALANRFTPLGLTIWEAPTEYRYTFNADHFIKKDFVGTTSISRQKFDYSTFYFKEAYSYLFNNNLPTFGKYVSAVNVDTKDTIAFKFRRGIVLPHSFQDLILTEGHYTVEVTGEGFNVWPG